NRPPGSALVCSLTLCLGHPALVVVGSVLFLAAFLTVGGEACASAITRAAGGRCSRPVTVVRKNRRPDLYAASYPSRLRSPGRVTSAHGARSGLHNRVATLRVYFRRSRCHARADPAGVPVRRDAVDADGGVTPVTPLALEFAGNPGKP